MALLVNSLRPVNSLPVTEFEAIECDITSLEDFDGYDDLNTDQKYLFKIVYAVATGICSPELAARLADRAIVKKYDTKSQFQTS